MTKITRKASRGQMALFLANCPPHRRSEITADWLEERYNVARRHIVADLAASQSRGSLL